MKIFHNTLKCFFPILTSDFLLTLLKKYQSCNHGDNS